MTILFHMNLCKHFSTSSWLLRAPKKQKHITPNHSPLINKAILKAIMGRSWLRNKLFKTRSNEDKRACDTQRNYYITLVRKAKKYINLHHKNVTDNRIFWKYIEPLFSEKSSIHNKITSIERDLILDKNETAPEFGNNIFINVVSNLNIRKYHDQQVN